SFKTPTHVSRMIPVKTFLVCVTVVFSLYFMGVLNIILLLALDTMPGLSSVVTIKEVPDQAAPDPMSEQESINKLLKEAMDAKKIEMSQYMKEVVTVMEDLVKDVDIDSLTEQGRWDALADLYDKFPMMEKVFEKALSIDSTLGNDPTITKDHQDRFASIKKSLDSSKATMVKQLREKGSGQVNVGKNTLEQENSYQFEEEDDLKSFTNEIPPNTENENNISEQKSKPNKNTRESEDPMERINIHTEL
ncbi:unnamed protein product, partial [Meganyctiphanes norvegica]